MTPLRCLVGAAVLAAVGLAVVAFRTPEPVRAAPDDRTFDGKAAIKVMLKSQVHEYLERPRVERIGGRAFIAGARFNSNASVCLPVDDVLLIEEYSSHDEIFKAYPGLAPKKEPAKPAPTTVTPEPPKKN